MARVMIADDEELPARWAAAVLAEAGHYKGQNSFRITAPDGSYQGELSNGGGKTQYSGFGC